MVRKKKAKKKTRVRTVDLSAPLALLLEYLDEALCNAVFQDVRTKERQREWTLFMLARFWISVILKAPPALSHLLEKTRSGDGTGLLPSVGATDEAFYQRCKTLPSTFFSTLYWEFVSRIEKDALPCYASKLSGLRDRFTSMRAIDGSRLDAIAHRCKILWREKAVVLPGCLTAVYDLFRGIAPEIWFDADAAASEFNRAMLVFETLQPGELFLGDRLYCSIQIFDLLDAQKCFGVFRRNRSIKLKKDRLLSRTERDDGGVLEDWLVTASSGETARVLRQIILKRKGKKARSALTNALDPKLLSAEEIALLYPKRWQIERLFFDLKEVLNLNQFYAANPNAVAMQVYAAAMVHAAFRVSQGRIAKQVKVPPERISPAKLFPRLAVACISLIEFEFCFLEICKANPGVKLRKPDPRVARDTKTTLSAILVEPRNPRRRKRKYSRERATWKSLKKVRGGRKLT